MKQILLAGLESYSNQGDRILLDTCSYLVDRALSECCMNDSTSVSVVDLMKNSDSLRSAGYLSSWKKIISMGLTFLAEAGIKYLPKAKSLSYSLYTLKNYVKYRTYFKSCIQSADVLIFVGGAYLKYKGEEFQYSIRHLIRLAQKYHTPVMLNAVGIEGYNSNDIRCKKTKEVINYNCVKVITTRDDLDFLNDNYISNDKIITGEVGDPALWVKECYHIEQNPSVDVGINVSYASLFEYNHVKTEMQLFPLLTEIIEKLKDKGVSFSLFCNGKAEDYEGGKQLLDLANLSGKELLRCPSSASEYIEEVALFRCVVPVRFHASIVSYALGIPTAGFIWNEKCLSFLEKTKQKPYFQPLNSFSSDVLTDTISTILSQGNHEDTFEMVMKNKTYSYLLQFLQTHL